MPNDLFERHPELYAKLILPTELEMDPDLGIMLNRINLPDHPSPIRHLTDGGCRVPVAIARDRLQVVLITAIALFSMAVFFYGAMRLTKHIQHFNFRPMFESTADAPAGCGSKPFLTLKPDHPVPLMITAWTCEFKNAVQVSNLTNVRPENGWAPKSSQTHHFYGLKIDTSAHCC